MTPEAVRFLRLYELVHTLGSPQPIGGGPSEPPDDELGWTEVAEIVMDMEIKFGWWPLASRRPCGQSLASGPEAWEIDPLNDSGSLSRGQESVGSSYTCCHDSRCA